MEPPSDAWQGQKNLLGVFFFVCVCGVCRKFMCLVSASASPRRPPAITFLSCVAHWAQPQPSKHASDRLQVIFSV